MTDLEKMARAMYGANMPVPWERASAFERTMILNIARAALQAIREPSASAVKAMATHEMYEHEIEAVWTEMIDHILAEKTP